MADFVFQTDHGPMEVAIDRLIVAGWTGRDVTLVQHHIDELAALGVPAPFTVPLYYQAGAELLTQVAVIAVLGTATSGEAEPMLVADAEGALWLGLGSDHTDRELEAISVAKSKQICPKPIADTLWRFDDLRGHLDQISLQSQIMETESGGFVPYQVGTLASIKPLNDLIAGLPEGQLRPRSAMLCGTLPVLGSIRAAKRFRMILHDPVRGRSIARDYAINTLPIVV